VRNSPCSFKNFAFSTLSSSFNFLNSNFLRQKKVIKRSWGVGTLFLSQMPQIPQSLNFKKIGLNEVLECSTVLTLPTPHLTLTLRFDMYQVRGPVETYRSKANFCGYFLNVVSFGPRTWNMV
jgi:hypothetical protein